MLKKITVLFLTFIILIPSLFTFAAEGASVSINGPEMLVEGKQVELTFNLNAKSVSAFSGEIKVDTEKLEFVEASIDISNSWEIETNKVEDIIYFACADTKGNNNIISKTEVFTATFKVLSFGEGDTVNVIATALKVSGGNSTIELKDAVYSCTYSVFKPENGEDGENHTGDTENDEDWDNTYDDYDFGEDEEEEIVQETGPSHNNMLKSLVVKNAEITPDFDPEIKKYEATVPYETEELQVEAVADDPNATVEISKTELIYVGRNITKVVVLSESGLQRTYKIYTTRLAPEKKTDTDGNLNLGIIIPIIIGAALLITAIILLVVFRKKIFKGKA